MAVLTLKRETNLFCHKLILCSDCTTTEKF